MKLNQSDMQKLLFKTSNIQEILKELPEDLEIGIRTNLDLILKLCNSIKNLISRENDIDAALKAITNFEVNILMTAIALDVPLKGLDTVIESSLDDVNDKTLRAIKELIND